MKKIKLAEPLEMTRNQSEHLGIARSLYFGEMPNCSNFNEDPDSKRLLIDWIEYEKLD